MSPLASHWCDDLPTRWESRRLKYLTTCNDEVLSEHTHPGLEVQYIDIGSVNSRGQIERAEAMPFSGAPSRARRVVRGGDVLVSTVRTYLRAIAPVVSPPNNMIASTGFAVIRCQGEAWPGYMAYALRTEGFVGDVIARSVGVSYPAINASELGNLFIPAPPLEEQTQIAKFLDYETAKIDHLIDKQQQLIALLKEKRQAVISHAVTKGLNPKAPMKDSGIEWLGEVPAHWKVAAVSTRYSTQLGKMLNEQSANGPNQFPYLRNANVRWETVDTSDLNTMSFSSADRLKFELLPEDLLVCEGGANIKVVGRTAIWRGEVKDCYYQKALHRLRPTRNSSGESPEFFMHLMRHIVTLGVFIAESNPNTVFHLTGEKLRSHRVPFPPASEQERIVTYLTVKLKRIDEVARLAQQQVELLQERRTALISAAVTGKSDVRNWQPPEVEATQEVA